MRSKIEVTILLFCLFWWLAGENGVASNTSTDKTSQEEDRGAHSDEDFLLQRENRRMKIPRGLISYTLGGVWVTEALGSCCNFSREIPLLLYQQAY